MTDPGEGLTEAEIVRWLVAEGDEVKINDIVVEVETSKSLVELPIPWAGRVDALLAQVGETVEVGAPLIRIDDGSGDEESAQSGRTPNLVGYGPTEGATKRRTRRGTREPDAGAAAAHEQAEATFDSPGPVGRPSDAREPLKPATGVASGERLPEPGQPAQQDHPPRVSANRVLAKPPLRKYAKDRGVDLTQLTGTGNGGVITRADVDAHLEARAAAPAPAASGAAAGGARHRHPGLEDRREPIRGVRKATAAAMVSSAFTAPHASEWVTLDVTASMELLERIRKRREFREVKVSPLLLVAKAVCLALRRTPEMNTSWDEEAQEIVYHGRVNLGIAAATPRGLLVPNIPDAASMELLELAHALNEATERAKEGRTQPSELSGGTFTITNVGPFGIDSGTPILNPGEAGILALGQIARRAWVVGEGADERIEPRWVTTLAVSFDHRLMDGEGSSLFLADVARILADPGQALLF
ncbi:dihydrolipoamide acetyltransferase family protein [Granulicoccus sp. GXG6511]|uniref:dihydrolipoamide acetyltransferase family protein n=1 Tax=Granulicoccus sp. GXG6511 TaxID=3381351 RepID=UPI003D7DF2CE